MTRAVLLMVAVLAVGTTACSRAPETSGEDSRAAVGREARHAAPSVAVLPPSISGSRSFRCADNSLALVDFYSDRRSAGVRTDPEAPLVRVSAAEAGGIMTAPGGWSLAGGVADARVRFASPDHPAPMACHA